jgi:hypothetical protein
MSWFREGQMGMLERFDLGDLLGLLCLGALAGCHPTNAAA